MILGSILMSLGLILAGFSTEIWHVYLTQGVLFGVGSSLAYMSIVATIPQWFTTRRGTAMGFSSSGSGFGGLALSPMVNSLVIKFGLPWTYRIVGFFSFGVLMIASFLIRSRLPPGFEKRPINSPIKVSMLKDANFVILVAGFVLSLTATFIICRVSSTSNNVVI
jgi:MFS family permease